MADILICGMDMPKNHRKMILMENGDITDIDGRTIAKAIELPPHGRLIDADALLNKLQKLYDERECEARYTGSKEIKVCWNEAVYQIIDAPTIIPPEGGDADAG